jgi:histidinol dehydrogenase
MHILDWKSLLPSEQRTALQRPAQRDAQGISAAARVIIDEVRKNGDAALKELTHKFDGVRLGELAVSAQ